MTRLTRNLCKHIRYITTNPLLFYMNAYILFSNHKYDCKFSFDSHKPINLLISCGAIVLGLFMK